MKFLHFLTIAIATCTLVACGSSKSTTTQDETELKTDKCEDLVHQQPEIRAWGEGEGFTVPEAITAATLNARAKMAASIGATVEALASQTSQIVSKGTRSNNMGATTVQDRQAESGQGESSYAKQAVNNTVEIANSKYQRKDGTYRCVVCIEYRQGIEKLTDDIINEVYQQIPDDEKQSIKENLGEYRQRVRDELSDRNKGVK